MVDTLSGITFAHIEHCVVWPLIIFAASLLYLRCCSLQQQLGILAAPRYRSMLIYGFSWNRKKLKLFLSLSALSSLAIAFLQPQWHRKEEQILHQGRDLIIALDVSQSMLAQDSAPNRLCCAKEKIKLLIKQLGAERVGLIIFSGKALIQCPPTIDHDAFLFLLDAIEVENSSSGTTVLSEALKKALDIYSHREEQRHKLIIALTDGEDFSHDLEDIKHQAQNLGVQIFTVGLGTPDGSPIPLYSKLNGNSHHNGYLKDDKDTVVISALNEPFLQTLAHDLGGGYVRATGNSDDIARIVQWVTTFEKEQLGMQKLNCLQEKYHYFTALTLLLLTIEWLL
jgi:Ca-activated chloride channel family protein